MHGKSAVQYNRREHPRCHGSGYFTRRPSERIATFQEEDPSLQPASAVQTRSQVKATRAKPFQELKKRISSPPILRLPDVSQPFILQTDASHLGVGAVLLQEDTACEKDQLPSQAESCSPESADTQRSNENVSRSRGVSRSSKNTYTEQSLFLRQTTSHSSISGKPNSRTDAYYVGLLYCNLTDFGFGLFVAETM